MHAGRRDHRAWPTRPARRCWSTAARRSPHLPVDVQALDCDFYVFSGHKIYGPTGIGVPVRQGRAAGGHAALAGRRRHDRPVTFEKTDLQADPPHKFEAGTPAIAQAPSRWARRIDYVDGARPGRASPRTRHALLDLCHAQRWRQIDGLRIIGTAPAKAAIVSFVIDGVHPHDIGTILDREGVAVRAGHHCAQPVMDALRHRRDRACLLRRSTTRWRRGRGTGCGARQGQGDVRLMDDLRELYQEVILDHGKHPRNFRQPEDCNRQAEGDNPLCGDQLDGLPEGRWRRDRAGRRLPGARLRHLDGVGLDDDRDRPGQDRGRGPRAVRALS